MPNACSLGGDFTVPCPPYESPTFVYHCSDFDSVSLSCNVYEWIEVSEIQVNSSLDVSDPVFHQLLASILYLFALAWAFKFLVNFILELKR